MVESKLKAYPPQPGRQIQVIGAGLPRTGTNSFCAALAILLNGPPYHVGVQYVLAPNDETAIKNWIAMMDIWPPSNAAQKQDFLSRLHRELDGYVAVTDPPASLLVPELMELYPDAKVIVSTREKSKWAASMYATTKLILPLWFANFLYFFIPTLRHVPTLWWSMPTIYKARYGETMTDEASIERIYNRHHEWLREIVPKEKLFFVDVKGGWEPLCEALGMEVPHGVEYPRLNDGKAMEELFKGFAVTGLVRWGMVLGALGAVAAAVWWMRGKGMEGR